VRVYVSYISRRGEEGEEEEDVLKWEEEEV